MTCKKTGLTCTFTFANKGFFKGENNSVKSPVTYGWVMSSILCYLSHFSLVRVACLVSEFVRLACIISHLWGSPRISQMCASIAPSSLQANAFLLAKIISEQSCHGGARRRSPRRRAPTGSDQSNEVKEGSVLKLKRGAPLLDLMSRMNASRHVWKSHVTYEQVMSLMIESCHVWMSRVTYEW